MGEPFIAVDWGTTNRRAYLIEGGAVIDGVSDDRGVLAMAGQGYEAAGPERAISCQVTFPSPGNGRSPTSY